VPLRFLFAIIPMQRGPLAQKAKREVTCDAIDSRQTERCIAHYAILYLMRRLRPLRAAALPAISPAYAYYTLNREPFCAGINTSLTPSRTLSCDRRAALQRPSQLFIPHNKEFIPLYSILTNYPLLFTHCSRPNHCSLLIAHCSLLIAHYSLLTANSSLLIPHYPLRRA
jgi:hypothetical protein